MTSNVDGEVTPIDAVNSRTSIIPELEGKNTLHVGFSEMATSQILAHGDFGIAVLSDSRRLE
jgi:hypothetical protein